MQAVGFARPLLFGRARGGFALVPASQSSTSGVSRLPFRHLTRSLPPIPALPAFPASHSGTSRVSRLPFRHFRRFPPLLPRTSRKSRHFHFFADRFAGSAWFLGHFGTDSPVVHDEEGGFPCTSGISVTGISEMDGFNESAWFPMTELPEVRGDLTKTDVLRPACL